jgi:hypothetical protein
MQKPARISAARRCRTSRTNGRGCNRSSATTSARVLRSAGRAQRHQFRLCGFNLAYQMRPKQILLFGFDMKRGPAGEPTGIRLIRGRRRARPRTANMPNGRSSSAPRRSCDASRHRGRESSATARSIAFRRIPRRSLRRLPHDADTLVMAYYENAGMLTEQFATHPRAAGRAARSAACDRGRRRLAGSSGQPRTSAVRCRSIASASTCAGIRMPAATSACITPRPNGCC